MAFVAEYKERANLVSTTGQPYSLEGTAPTQVDALAELNAKLGVSVGTVVSASSSVTVDPATRAAYATTGDNGKAIWNGQSTAAGTKRTVTLYQVARFFKQAGLKNPLLDTSLAPVTAVMSQYVDAQGNTDYNLTSTPYFTKRS